MIEDNPASATAIALTYCPRSEITPFVPMFHDLVTVTCAQAPLLKIPSKETIPTATSFCRAALRRGHSSASLRLCGKKTPSRLRDFAGTTRHPLPRFSSTFTFTFTNPPNPKCTAPCSL